MDWNGRRYDTREEKQMLLKYTVSYIYDKLHQYLYNNSLRDAANFQRLVDKAKNEENDEDKLRYSTTLIQEWRSIYEKNKESSTWKEWLYDINALVGLLEETTKKWSDKGRWTLIPGPGHLVISTDTANTHGTDHEKASDPRVKMRSLLAKLQSMQN